MKCILKGKVVNTMQESGAYNKQCWATLKEITTAEKNATYNGDYDFLKIKVSEKQCSKLEALKNEEVIFEASASNVISIHGKEKAIDFNYFKLLQKVSYYHVSLMSNLESILRDGLTPKIGERSIEAKEKEEAIYLFPSIDDMDNALMGWLGDWYTDKYGDEIPLATLKIEIPPEITVYDGVVGYEKIVKTTIPPKHITFLREE